MESREVQEEFSEPRAKSQLNKQDRYASEYNKSYSASSRYFHGKSPMIIPSFFTATMYLSITFVTDLFPFAFDLSLSSPITASLVLFFSQTSILMCNSFLSNWNWLNGNQLQLKKFNGKKFPCKNFHQMPATKKLQWISFTWIFSTMNFSQTMVYVCISLRNSMDLLQIYNTWEYTYVDILYIHIPNLNVKVLK